jgi:O-antigen ligase
LFLLGAVLMVVAAFGSQSRGAFLAVIACALFLLLKTNKKLVSFVILLALLPAVYSFMPDSWHERMGTIVVDEEAGEVRESSSASRLNAWRAGEVRARLNGDSISLGRLHDVLTVPS